MAVEYNTYYHVCRGCGEHVNYSAEELQACAACESLFCWDCITWCCEEEDEANGDYFCVTCASNGESSVDP